MGSRAGPRGLQHLPRSARLEQRPDARREAAGALPELSHRHQASVDDLRRERARFEKQSHHRPGLRELPRADPRVRTVRPATRCFASEGTIMQTISPSNLSASITVLWLLAATRERRTTEHAAARAGPEHRDLLARQAARSISGSAARSTATTRTRRAISATAICATGCSSKISAGARATTTKYLGRPRDERRLSRPAVRRELQQVREDEGVVRLQPDPALLQPGHAHRVHDEQSGRARPRRLSGAGAERRCDERDLQRRRDRHSTCG